MLKMRAVYIVEVNLDPVPGWGHQPEDHVRLIHDVLEDRIGHYLPSVRFERQYEVETFDVGHAVVTDHGELVTYKVNHSEDYGDRLEVSVSSVVAAGIMTVVLDKDDMPLDPFSDPTRMGYLG